MSTCGVSGGLGITEAGKQLARLVHDIGEDTAGMRATMACRLDEWIRHGETPGRSPNTRHGYRPKAFSI